MYLVRLWFLCTRRKGTGETLRSVHNSMTKGVRMIAAASLVMIAERKAVSNASLHTSEPPEDCCRRRFKRKKSPESRRKYPSIIVPVSSISVGSEIES